MTRLGGCLPAVSSAETEPFNCIPLLGGLHHYLRLWYTLRGLTIVLTRPLSSAGDHDSRQPARF
jgi:hypothetical protein